jgi:hypothetical protein
MIRAIVLSIECDRCEYSSCVSAGEVSIEDTRLYRDGKIALFTLATKYRPEWHFDRIHLCPVCAKELGHA